MRTQYLITTVIVVILFSISGFILLQERYKPDPMVGTRTFEFYIDNSEKKPTPITKPYKSAEQPVEQDTILAPHTNIKQPTFEPTLVNTREIELSIHNLVNQVRQEHGLHPLIWNEELANVARSHSKDMAERGYFAHESPEGVTPQERGKQHGFEVCGEVDDNDFRFKTKYNFQKRVLFTGIAENLVISYDFKNTAIDAVSNLMDSPPHRRNILHEYMTNQGIGVAIKNNEAYITQNLC